MIIFLVLHFLCAYCRNECDYNFFVFHTKTFSFIAFVGQVVPFTPSAGVLEWVNGTFPLGEYLIGRLVKLSFA